MLKKIVIRNFKAFGEKTEVELNKLNIFSGLNSNGKSSLYQALLLFTQSLDSWINYNNILLPVLQLNGKYINLGNEEEILFFKEDKKIFFSFEWENGMTLSSEYELDLKHKKFILIYSKYTNSKSSYELEKKEKVWRIKAKNLLNFTENEISIELDKIYKSVKDRKYLSEKVEFNNSSNLIFHKGLLIAFQIDKEEMENVLSLEYKRYFDKEKFFREKITKIELRTSLLKEDMFRLFLLADNLYIPAFRGMPQRVYLEEKSPLKRYIEAKNEPVIYDIDLDFKEESKKIKRGTLEEALNYWIATKFNIAEGINVKESIGNLISEIFVKVNGKEISINNVGFGASQIIPIIADVLTSGRKKITIIDEPEIHLHPKLQSQLAEFFYKMSLLHPNIIIETHSEYLIEKLIYFKIKYSSINNINMYWVDKISNDKGSQIIEIEYDDYGYILNPPENFLSEKKKIVEELQKIRLEKIENEE